MSEEADTSSTGTPPVGVYAPASVEVLFPDKYCTKMGNQQGGTTSVTFKVKVTWNDAFEQVNGVMAFVRNPTTGAQYSVAANPNGSNCTNHICTEIYDCQGDGLPYVDSWDAFAILLVQQTLTSSSVRIECQ